MLNSFNTMVLNVAIVILIITLIFIGVIINNSIRGEDIQFPPVVGTCPDYWTAQIDSSSNVTCNNTLYLGKDVPVPLPNSNTPSCVSFTSPLDVPTECAKYRLANSCGITWDGVTNNPDNRENC